METGSLKVFFNTLYQNFNERHIDAVIATMNDDVKWANGMDGGYVYGKDGVAGYWKRQFSIVHSKVTPLKVEDENGVVKIKVHQVVYDLKSNLLADELVWHFFHLKEGKISEFHIGEKLN